MILVAYSLLVATVLAIFLIERFIFKTKWHSPINVFVVLILLYVSPLTLRYIYDLPIEGNVTEYFYQLKNIYPLALVATTISIVFFYLAYLVAPVLKITKVVINKSERLESKYLRFSLAGYFLLFLGVGIFLILSINYGGPLAVILTGYAVTEIFSANPLLGLSTSIVSTSSLFMLFAYRQTNQKKHLINSLIIIIFTMLLLIVMARRAEIATWGMTYLIVYCLLIKHISFKKILPAVLLGFAFLNVLGFARQANYDSISAFNQSFEEQYNNLNQDNSGLFYTITTGQFVVPYETVPMLMEKMHSSEMRYGATLFDIGLQWIPRAFWSDKSYGNGVWYYQKYYDSSALPNEGRQFFFLAEGYLNFGILGMVLWAVLWGVFWKNIYFLVNYSKVTDMSAYIYAVYIAGMIMLMPGDFVSIFVAFPKSYLIWFFLGYIISYLGRVKNYGK